jgi:hypothetical protein
MKNQNEIKKFWEDVATDVLKGRTIVSVKYISEDEAKELGWYNKSISFTLDDGTICFVSCDDEGNDAGALFYTNEKERNGTLPVIRL